MHTYLHNVNYSLGGEGCNASIIGDDVPRPFTVLEARVVLVKFACVVNSEPFFCLWGERANYENFDENRQNW